MKTKMIVMSGLLSALLVFSGYALAQGPGQRGGGSSAAGASNYQRGPAKQQDMRGDRTQDRIRMQDQLQKQEQRRLQERQQNQEQRRIQERVREHQPEGAQSRSRQQTGTLPEEASDTARAAREFSGQGQGTADAVRANQGPGEGRVLRDGNGRVTAPGEQ